jgi:hypothetical protein
VTNKQLGDILHWAGVIFLIGAFLAELYDHL